MSIPENAKADYANLTTRSVALFIDYAFWNIVFIVSGKISTPLVLSAIPELLTPVISIGILAYFWLPPKFGKATLGQYVMGIRIVAAEYEKPNYILRLFLGFISLWFWVLTLVWRFVGMFQLQEQSNVLWWDRHSQTRTVLMRRASRR